MPEPLRLGIIGAENSHSWVIAQTCNVQKKVPVRVTHLWGETRKAARDSAQEGSIPHIVSHWERMSGLVDGVMIDHRDGADHSEAARFFIEKGVPVFVDKPMTRNLQEAKSLLALAAKHGTPVATYGIVPLQRRFRAFSASLAAAGDSIRFIDAVGPADLTGPYGGIFYYGFHQADAVIELMGTDIESVSLQRSGDNGIATLFFRGNRSAVLHFLKSDWQGFRFQACVGSTLKALDAAFDPNPYLTAARVLAKFLKTGIPPQSNKRMLAPISVLQALERSLATGRLEKVAGL